MSSVIGVSSLYQTAAAEKPPLMAAALASPHMPASFLRFVPEGASRGRPLVVSAIATPDSVLSEEALTGLGGLSIAKLPLQDNDDGGFFDDNEDYEPVDSIKQRQITHLFPVKAGEEEEKLAEGVEHFDVPTTSTSKHAIFTDFITKATQPRAVSRLWHLSTAAAYNAMLLFPTKALADMCGVTSSPQAASTAEEGIINSTYCLSHGPLFLADLDPATAKLAIGIIGPLLSAYGFLFILRIVMSWYPRIPVGKFPYVVAYAPTEPVLILTRKLIPPLGGVDVTPVVWFGLVSFLSEILVGPQGLLVLLSQQKV